MIDPVDARILSHIQANGRDTLADIAKIAGLSVSAVNGRLKRLETDGVITGWQARVAPEAIGCSVLAYMFVLVSTGAEKAFRRWISTSNEVLECHHVTGDWSYVLKLRVEDLETLDTFLDATKARGIIEKSHSILALRTFKETSQLPVRGGE